MIHGGHKLLQCEKAERQKNERKLFAEWIALPQACWYMKRRVHNPLVVVVHVQ